MNKNDQRISSEGRNRLERRLGGDSREIVASPCRLADDAIAESVYLARMNRDSGCRCGATGSTVYDPATKRMYLDSCRERRCASLKGRYRSMLEGGR